MYAHLYTESYLHVNFPRIDDNTILTFFNLLYLRYFICQNQGNSTDSKRNQFVIDLHSRSVSCSSILGKGITCSVKDNTLRPLPVCFGILCAV